MQRRARYVAVEMCVCVCVCAQLTVSALACAGSAWCTSMRAGTGSNPPDPEQKGAGIENKQKDDSSIRSDLRENDTLTVVYITYHLTYRVFK